MFWYSSAWGFLFVLLFFPICLLFFSWLFAVNSCAYRFSKLNYLGMARSPVPSLEQELRKRALKYFWVKLNAMLIHIFKKYIF